MLSYTKQGSITDLQVTCKECGSFGFGHHSDLLEGQEVMDMDVVLCGDVSIGLFSCHVNEELILVWSLYKPKVPPIFTLHDILTL